jgi:glycosyltransferase involved in cell wall biosynthesis
VKVLVVSHLYPSPARAGSLFVHEQVLALRDLGLAVSVVSPTAYAPRPLQVNDRLRARGATPQAAKIDGVAVRYPRVLLLPRRLLFQRSGDLFYRGLRPLLPGLRAEGFDLVHAHQALPDGASARLLAADLGVPYVVTVHGGDVNVNLARPGAVRDRTVGALRGAAAVVGVSGAVTTRLAGIVPTDRLHTVPNGVTGLEPVAPCDFSPGRPLVLSVANLYASKGHAAVLDALARLAPTHGDIVYAVVGDGPQRKPLESRARKLGLSARVRFLGWRAHDDVLALMARADAFVLPSAPEGFGLVYAEAMAQGTPVVACRGEGPADFVDDGESGLLVPPRDAGAVATAIARLLDDPATAARLAAAGRAAVAGLTWRCNAERQLAIYERVLATRRPEQDAAHP